MCDIKNVYGGSQWYDDIVVNYNYLIYTVYA